MIKDTYPTLSSLSGSGPEGTPRHKSASHAAMTLLSAIVFTLFFCASLQSVLSAAQKPASGDIYVGSALSPGYNMGVNTSEEKSDWVKDERGYMKCAYPRGQSWGAVFITCGKPVPASEERKSRDCSSFRYLSMEIRGARGGESVNVGVKRADDADDGNEPKFPVKHLTKQWRLVKIPLKKLVDGESYPASRFHKLYVVCEFVFEQDTPAETICFRNVRYTR